MSAPSATDVVAALLEWSKGHENPAAFLRAVRDGLSKRVGKEEMLRAVIVTPDRKAGEDLKKNMQELLQKKGHASVEITERADPSLIGGALLIFGDEQVDMSVRGALRQAAETFASGTAA